MGSGKVIIGDPFDPDFHWRGAGPGKAEPRALSELPASDRLWEALGRRFERGQLAARRTADSSWIGLVTRRELLTLVEESSAPGEAASPALRQAIGGLDDRTIYYVVARPSGAGPADGEG